MSGFTVSLVSLVAAMVAVSYGRQWWPRVAVWARWRARRPRFDSSPAFRHRLAIWKGQRP